LRSHFYINEVISLNDLVTQAKRKRFSNTITRIKLFCIHKPVPISTASKGISKPIEPQFLSVEMDLMLDTILAAHAPTEAMERSSLHQLSN
jgi:hypothetical protein